MNLDNEILTLLHQNPEGYTLKEVVKKLGKKRQITRKLNSLIKYDYIAKVPALTDEGKLTYRYVLRKHLPFQPSKLSPKEQVFWYVAMPLYEWMLDQGKDFLYHSAFKDMTP